MGEKELSGEELEEFVRTEISSSAGADVSEPEVEE